MPAIKTIHFQNDHISFKYVISINGSGEFSTMLPEIFVDELTKYGIETPKSKFGKPGRISANTLDDLIRKVHDLSKQLYSTTIIKDEIVLRYTIQTSCSYCLDIDNNIVPNGSSEWVRKDTYEWKGGNLSTHSANPYPYGILVYVKPFPYG